MLTDPILATEDTPEGLYRRRKMTWLDRAFVVGIIGKGLNGAADRDLDHDRVEKDGRVDAFEGRLAHSAISSITLSVIRDTVYLLTEAP